jgi:hypothetical protein
MLSDADKPQAMAWHLLHIKPLSIIRNSRFNSFASLNQRQTNQSRFAMFGDVVECILENSENDQLQGGGNLLLLNFNVLVNAYAGMSFAKFAAQPPNSPRSSSNEGRRFCCILLISEIVLFRMEVRSSRCLASASGPSFLTFLSRLTMDQLVVSY